MMLFPLAMALCRKNMPLFQLTMTLFTKSVAL
jgi:hypothetical protein